MNLESKFHHFFLAVKLCQIIMRLFCLGQGAGLQYRLNEVSLCCIVIPLNIEGTVRYIVLKFCVFFSKILCLAALLLHDVSFETYKDFHVEENNSVLIRYGSFCENPHS